MQIKTTIRYNLIFLRTVTKKKTKHNKCLEGYGQKQPLCTTGWNVNWFRHYGNQYVGSSKKIKTELSYNSGIQLLGIYEKTLTLKDICTSIFTAASFTID